MFRCAVGLQTCTDNYRKAHILRQSFAHFVGLLCLCTHETQQCCYVFFLGVCPRRNILPEQVLPHSPSSIIRPFDCSSTPSLTAFFLAPIRQSLEDVSKYHQSHREPRRTRKIAGFLGPAIVYWAAINVLEELTNSNSGTSGMKTV